MNLSEMLVEYDKFAQVNSNDVITLKMLHRHFKDVVYKELGGKKDVPYLKDKLLVWAKDISKNNPRLNYKKATDYINQVYGTQGKITYSAFVKGLQGLDIAGGNAWIMDPDEQTYNTTQRLVPSPERNKTTTVLKDYSVLDNILKKYSGEFPDDVAQIEDLAKHGHFNNSVGFIRFTVVDKSWVHIDAFQTDFFNRVRSFAANKAKEGSKDAKKLYSEILGTEDEVFKTALSHTKFKNPSAKIWTMNTGTMIKEIEHVSSGDKAADIYDTFPAKLGFKRIPMEQFKKVLDTRHINIQKKSLADKLFGNEGNSGKPFEVKETLNLLSTPEKQKEIVAAIKRSFSDEKYKPTSLGAIQNTIRGIVVRACFGTAFPHFDEDSKIGSIMEDIAHQLALFTWNADLGDSGEVIWDNLSPQRLQFKLNSLVQGFKDNTEGKEEMKYPDIWWANRDMLNEDTISFNEALFERLGR